MKHLFDQARTAASQVVGEVDQVRHVETLPTGEEVFAVSSPWVGPLTVSINPNGLKAGVEGSFGYRICLLGSMLEPQRSCA